MGVVVPATHFLLMSATKSSSIPAGYELTTSYAHLALFHSMKSLPRALQALMLARCLELPLDVIISTPGSPFTRG